MVLCHAAIGGVAPKVAGLGFTHTAAHIDCCVLINWAFKGVS